MFTSYVPCIAGLWFTQLLFFNELCCRKLQAEGLGHVAARRIEAAEASIAMLKLNSARVAPLHGLPEQEYYSSLISHMEQLKRRAVKQLEIVTELAKIANKSEESLSREELDNAARLVADARDMSDFDDPTIDACEGIVQCFMMADKAARSMASVKELSAADIAQTVLALTRFKHVLPAEAAAVILQANTYMDSIRAEMEQYVPRISAALSVNSLTFNRATGELDGDTCTLRMEEALKGIDESDLVSFECKRMVALCQLCIRLRHLVVAGDDATLLTTVKKVFVCVSDSSLSHMSRLCANQTVSCG